MLGRRVEGLGRVRRLPEDVSAAFVGPRRNRRRPAESSAAVLGRRVDGLGRYRRPPEGTAAVRGPPGVDGPGARSAPPVIDYVALSARSRARYAPAARCRRGRAPVRNARLTPDTSASRDAVMMLEWRPTPNITVPGPVDTST